MSKEPGAFLTIGELSDELGVAQHILRYWESKFSQLSPLKRAGNRRYYRPADVEVARRIQRLLGQQGYTIKGAQKALRDGSAETVASPPLAAAPAPSPLATPAVDLQRLRGLRDRLQAALDA
ncbi:MerR family transcriptional regulator [Sphingomicrobium flavum]|uniref:MerR family transcriptional regulator n=1 Tax=Sphingomicrobium flavum TaxID=1229164 RepID=UPI0021AD93E1|nr:MerR family transcriptional regulator [Sphingomicrobium flavum]